MEGSFKIDGPALNILRKVLQNQVEAGQAWNEGLYNKALIKNAEVNIIWREAITLMGAFY